MKISKRQWLVFTFCLLWAIIVTALFCRADQPAAHGHWFDPPGYLVQCLYCPDSGTSDCIQCQPIFLEIDQPGHLHVTQAYQSAFSTVNGMQYKGRLTLNVVNAGESVVVNLNCRWQREDGFTVRIVQRFRLLSDGSAKVEAYGTECSE